MSAQTTFRATDGRCPSCGRPYDYRIRDRNGVARSFHVANEYRCDPPQDPHVYFHTIDGEQAVRIAYDVHREVGRR